MEHIKLAFKKTITDVIEISHTRWRIDWQSHTPKMGTHYYYQEITQLESFITLKSELRKIPEVASKYSDDGIEGPILSLIKITLASIIDSEKPDRAVNHWWSLFCSYLSNDTVNVKMIVGLSNIKAEQNEYILNSETKLRWFGRKTLEEEVENIIPLWHEIVYPQDVSLQNCNGIIQVDFTLPAIDSRKYTLECIKRLTLLSEAIQLCGFGYVGVGPWVIILNPQMPMNNFGPVGEPGGHLSSLDMPELTINQEAWRRFCNIHAILCQIEKDNKANKEHDKAVRRRLQEVISRFTQTYEKGLWESVIVDIVILMESILTPNKQGGRLPLALAASNLLGKTQEESLEIYENINRLYSIRNGYVHGEPKTQEQWENELYGIANTVNCQLRKLDPYIQKLSFEIARDYARRSIVAILNLYYYEKRSPSNKLSKDLQIMHLDVLLKQKIQKGAQCYPFSYRSLFPNNNDSPDEGLCEVPC